MIPVVNLVVQVDLVGGGPGVLSHQDRVIESRVTESGNELQAKRVAT